MRIRVREDGQPVSGQAAGRLVVYSWVGRGTVARREQEAVSAVLRMFWRLVTGVSKFLEWCIYDVDNCMCLYYISMKTYHGAGRW